MMARRWESAAPGSGGLLARLAEQRLTCIGKPLHKLAESGTGFPALSQM